MKEATAAKRIFLFFLTRVIKTYSAVCRLSEEGYGQDAAPLLRNLLEMLISAKYILSNPSEADQKAVRFVEYKWVILKRYLSELEREFQATSADDLQTDRGKIDEKFEEFKKKYRIVSDRALVTWSGKTTKDMARAVHKNLLQEYEQAFRVDSRFYHPSIIGDREYLDYRDGALKFTFLPSANGVVICLRRAINYLMDFLLLFNILFDIKGARRIESFRSKLTEVFKMEKYKNPLSFEKTLPSPTKDEAGKILVQFDCPGLS